MMGRAIKLMLILACVMLALAVCSSPALAQCAMCKATVAQGAARSWNLAVLVLLIPPVSVFCMIFAVVYRIRNSDEKIDDAGTRSLEMGGQHSDDLER